MSKYLVSGERLTEIADAIRAQTGSTEAITLNNMVESIGNISGTNFNIIGGTEQPKTGDTLYWDGNTDNREIYDTGDGNIYYKVSDVVPTMAELSKGVTDYFRFPGADAMADDATGYIIDNTSDEVIWIRDGAVIIYGPTSGVSEGLYFGKFPNSGYTAAITINGFTGFEKEGVKENTIWVNTDTEITSWAFCAAQPENTSEGMVWIATSAASLMEFNALKKNVIQVRPLAAKQYISGVWANKSAKIYQSGVWIDFITYLYNKGDLYTDITGGWNTRGWRFQSGNGENVSTPVATYGDTSVKITSTEQASYRETGIWETKNDIDLTDIDTISFHVLAVTCNDGNAIIRLGAFNRSGSYAGSSSVAYTDLTSSRKSAGYYTVDVSNLSGSYAIGALLASWPNQISITLDEIKLYKE